LAVLLLVSLDGGFIVEVDLDGAPGAFLGFAMLSGVFGELVATRFGAG
jgi:hypothetical protein